MPSLYFSDRSILGTSIGDQRDFADLLDAAGRARWRPIIDSMRPLNEMRAAHERMETGVHFGKLLVVA